jgi:hypothetical protein
VVDVVVWLAGPLMSWDWCRRWRRFVAEIFVGDCGTVEIFDVFVVLEAEKM